LDEATPFVLAWRSRHPDTPPSVRAAYGYDALRIAAAALMWAGADRSGLRTALRDPRGHRGASGTIRFDEGGDAVVSPRIFVVEDGRFVDYAAHAAERRRELLRRLDALREGAEPAPGTDGDGAD